MPAGRPSKRFNRQVAGQILDRWCTSRLTLEQCVDEIRKSNTRCPSLRIVYAWKRENREFMQAYKHAARDRGDYLADLALAEACEPRRDVTRKVTDRAGKGRDIEFREKDNVPRSRLIAEMCMRRAEQLNPEYRERAFDVRSDSSTEELENLIKVLQGGPAPVDPDDPSLNLGMTKPDFTQFSDSREQMN
jgi:hypothetical protein